MRYWRIKLFFIDIYINNVHWNYTILGTTLYIPTVSHVSPVNSARQEQVNNDDDNADEHVPPCLHGDDAHAPVPTLLIISCSMIRK